MSSHGTFGIRTDGTLWYWGQATNGQNGTNENSHRSSPKQIPGTTWAKVYGGQTRAGAIKTDGTLWTWGSSTYGALGLNEGPGSTSSPKQIPGTTWSELSWSYNSGIAVKTDGTLWSWGYNGNGELGQSSPGPSRRSSPVQIPGTAWTGISKGFRNYIGFKTVSG